VTAIVAGFFMRGRMGGMPDEHRPLLQFSLRRVLVSLFIVAVGLSMCSYVLRENLGAGPELSVWFFYAGGAVAGAGVLNPFRLWWIGAILGMFAAIAISVILLVEAGV
jgi:integral membrane sensor domain MASE1